MASDPLFEAVAALSTSSGAAIIDDVLSQIAQARLNTVAERLLLKELKRRTDLPFDITEPRLSNLKRALVPVANGYHHPHWSSQIITTAEGEPVPVAKNVLTALRGDDAWKNVFAFDEFRQIPVFRNKPPFANGHWKDEITPISDADENRILVWIQEQGIITCRIEAVRQALSIIIDDNRFHPVRDYLNSIVWDGKPRIDKWLSYYLGVAPIENYTSAVGSRWLISAVARIFQPGCMAKYALILEGPQDLKKSSALEVLGGQWFTDDIDELGSKDSKLQVGNAWIIELAELDSMRRAEISSIKAFISRKTDRFRKPFGRYVVEVPRQCVLSGTINPSGQYFHDDTGAVRFWPVICTSIDLEALMHDRDQLWAEAVHRYRLGEPWWLDAEELTRAAHEEQEQRASTDVWTTRVHRWLDENQLRDFVTIEEVLTNALDLRISDCTRVEATRVGIILNRAGWISQQVRVRERRERRYYPPPHLGSV